MKSEDFVRLIEDYKQKNIKKEDLLNTLTIYKTINEISFYTEKSIRTLKFYTQRKLNKANILVCIDCDFYNKLENEAKLVDN